LRSHAGDHRKLLGKPKQPLPDAESARLPWAFSTPSFSGEVSDESKYVDLSGFG
jgi:hypothetical protein